MAIPAVQDTRISGIVRMTEGNPKPASCYNPPFPEMPWPLSVACAGKPHLTPARRSHHDEKN